MRNFEQTNNTGSFNQKPVDPDPFGGDRDVARYEHQDRQAQELRDEHLRQVSANIARRSIDLGEPLRVGRPSHRADGPASTDMFTPSRRGGIHALKAQDEGHER